LLRFVPNDGSDLARGIGLADRPFRGIALPLDALVVHDVDLACNAVVFGTPPDRLHPWSRSGAVVVTVDGRVAFEGRATTVAVASGEFLRGLDLSPRGHPGDGRAEIQIYAVSPGERRAVRSRLRTGSHLPHARITQRTGRRVEIRAARSRPVEVDGHPSPPRSELTVEVCPEAFRLLV
jgi:hypothetical protein